MVDDLPSPEAREKVVIVAPFGNDATVLERIVRQGGMQPFSSLAEARTLTEGLASGWDILLLTAEACRDDLLDVVSEAVAALPLVSAPPVVLIAESVAAARQAAHRLRFGRSDLPVAILIRPCDEIEIATALGVAKETRVTQLRLRDQLRERKRAEERADFLFRELSHRVANLFAMIKSLANQTLRSEPDGRSFRAAFGNRIDGLAGVYGALRADDWEAADLETVARGAILPLLAGGADTDRLTIRGPAVRLASGIATPLGLALHELANNARKYGALSVRAGRIDVTWRHAGEGELRLSWVEFGGPQVRPPEREGFGTTVIRSALDSLSGAKVDLNYPPEGVTCQFTLPAACLAEARV